MSWGKFGEGSEDEFGLTHVVAEVLGFQVLEILVRLDADSAPLLMDDIGEDGVFILFLDLVCSPIVGEFVAGLLPEPLRPMMPTLSPFFTSKLISFRAQKSR